jgi:hypothetical protein
MAQAQTAAQKLASESAPMPDTVSVIALAQRMWGQLRAQLQDQLQLLMLEIQSAIHSLIQMLICALVGALLLTSAWLALLTALLFWLLEQGMALSGAWLVVALCNGLAAAGLTLRYRHYQQVLRDSASLAGQYEAPTDTPHSGDPS